MKRKKIQNGCIYWDESSRGVSYPRPRGRWVGERIDNGKRVRMRSTNYDKVLKWVTGDSRDCKRIPLKGIQNYTIDPGRQEVFNRDGKPLKGHKVNGSMVYNLCIGNDERIFAPFNRLAYAALHNIDVRQIPHDIIVLYKDGEYILQHRCDFISQNFKDIRQRNMKIVESHLNRWKREIEILMRFYKTGDTAEIVTYAMQEAFQPLIKRVIARRHCSLEHATDIVLEATEIFLRKVTERHIPFHSITPAIMGLCQKHIIESSRTGEYYDNIRVKN